MSKRIHRLGLQNVGTQNAIYESSQFVLLLPKRHNLLHMLDALNRHTLDLLAMWCLTIADARGVSTMRVLMDDQFVAVVIDGNVLAKHHYFVLVTKPPRYFFEWDAWLEKGGLVDSFQGGGWDLLLVSG